MPLLQKQHKAKSDAENQAKEKRKIKIGRRILISVNVLGSVGPLRFLVNEDDPVAAVIDAALRSYAREGRLPVLGSDSRGFLLYCANADSEALDPLEPIGSQGGRSFILCKKRLRPQTAETAQKGSNGCKALLNKSLGFKILFH